MTDEEYARTPDMPQFYMVFDVESIGLHGEGFAVGYVVLSSEGLTTASGMYGCNPSAASGTGEDRDWVSQNCPTLAINCSSPRSVRKAFWYEWSDWRERGAVLVADCAWPVEARFLTDCVDDDLPERAWEGPYPLHELASFMVAAGMDPMATYDRLPTEPQHDPLGDARQSARLLMQALGRLRK